MAGDEQRVVAASERQRNEEERVFERLAPMFEEEARRLAKLLAGKEDCELFGKTEFEIRDRVHRLGAQALEAAADERQKKGGLRRC